MDQDTNKHLKETWLGVLDEYQVNEHNIITQPGRFEAEWLPTAYFWELAMHGFEDETVFDNENAYSVFELAPYQDTIPMLVEIADETHAVIWLSEAGFAHGEYVTTAQLEEWKEMCDENSEEL